MAKKFNWMALVLAMIILAGGAFAAYYYLVMAPQSDTSGFTATNYTFTVVDFATGNETDETDDIEIAMYECDVTGMDAQEIADLEYADFTYTENVTSGSHYDPDPAFVYMSLYTGVGFQSEWFEPVLGENIIYAMNLTEDVSELCHTVGGAFSTTLLNTAYQNWQIDLVTLDAAEGATAEMTSLEGYKTAYNFTDDSYNLVTLRIAYDNTAESSFAHLITNYEYTEVCVGNYTYFEVEMDLLGEADLDFRFSSELEGTGAYDPSTFNVLSVAVGYGNSGFFSAWDTQS